MSTVPVELELLPRDVERLAYVAGRLQLTEAGAIRFVIAEVLPRSPWQIIDTDLLEAGHQQLIRVAAVHAGLRPSALMVAILREHIESLPGVQGQMTVELGVNVVAQRLQSGDLEGLLPSEPAEGPAVAAPAYLIAGVKAAAALSDTTPPAYIAGLVDRYLDRLPDGIRYREIASMVSAA